MPGFFSAKVANKLTSQSGHLLDWSRVGSLIVAGNHRYSWYELAQRGFVMTSMVIGAYEGYQDSDEETFGLKTGLYTLAGCFVAFIVSHCLVIAPLVYKRLLMKLQCEDDVEVILSLLDSIQEISEGMESDSYIIQVASVVDGIMNLNLSDNKNARASQTLGTRVLLLNGIIKKLTQDVDCFKDSPGCGRAQLLIDKKIFWDQPQASLYTALKEFAASAPAGDLVSQAPKIS